MMLMSQELRLYEYVACAANENFTQDSKFETIDQIELHCVTITKSIDIIRQFCTVVLPPKLIESPILRSYNATPNFDICAGDMEIWPADADYSIDCLIICDQLKRSIFVTNMQSHTVLRSYGSNQLMRPGGIALWIKQSRADCLLFVADRGLNNVCVFHAWSGECIRIITSQACPLNDPSGLCVRQAQWPVHLLVVDRNNCQVSVFDAESGDYLRSICHGPVLTHAPLTLTPSHRRSPCGVAYFPGNSVLTQSLIFLVDNSNGRVEVYDNLTEKFLRTLGQSGSTDAGHLNHPISAAVFCPTWTSTPLLFVADNANHRIQVFDTVTSTVTVVIGGESVARPANPLLYNPFHYPQHLRVARIHNDQIVIFVPDHRNKRIYSHVMAIPSLS